MPGGADAELFPGDGGTPLFTIARIAYEKDASRSATASSSALRIRSGSGLRVPMALSVEHMFDPGKCQLGGDCGGAGAWSGIQMSNSAGSSGGASLR